MSTLPIFVGLDYHQDSIQVCVLNQKGDVLLNRSSRNDSEELRRLIEPLGAVQRVDMTPLDPSNERMYWLDRTDLHAALRELAIELGLAITDESLIRLDADLESTWYSGTYVDGRSIPGTWATLQLGADSPQFEQAEDECAGVFIRMRCDNAVRRRAVGVLARFNPLNGTLD